MKQLKGLALRQFNQEQLEREESRLMDLKKRGVKALSKYDIEIAHMGNAKEALATAKMLVSNHISYYKNQLNIGQQALF